MESHKPGQLETSAKIDGLMEKEKEWNNWKP